MNFADALKTRIVNFSANRLRSNRRRHQLSPIPACIEQLENRVLLSNYVLTKLVDTNTPMPGRTENFDSFGAGAVSAQLDLDGATVAFYGANNTSDVSGVYFATRGGVSKYRDSNDPFPGNSLTTIDKFDERAFLDGQTVGFAIKPNGSTFPVPFIGVGDNITRIVEFSDTPIPGGEGDFFGGVQNMRFGSGTIAFYGGHPSFQMGIYTSDGNTIEKAVDTNDDLPGTSGVVPFVEPVEMQVDAGQVVFSIRDQGIYVARQGVVQLVADVGSPVPGTSFTFTDVGDIVAIDNGNVAFTGQYRNANNLLRTAVFHWRAGETTLIANEETTNPDGGTFNSIAGALGVSVSGNNVAFVHSNTIYVSIDGEISRVIRRLDDLDGKSAFPVLHETSLDGTSLALQISFGGGQGSGIYLATLEGAVETPATPELTAPIGSIADATPTFAWGSDSAADFYDLWVNNRSTGQDEVIREQSLTTNSHTPTTDLPPGNYRAWVRAINITGGISDWSAAVDFTIESSAPGHPVLTSPAGTVSTVRPEFTWDAVSGADHYDLWVDNRSTGDKQVIRQQSLTGTTYTPAGDLAAGNYRAWIRAVNSSDEASEWSQAVNFTVRTETLDRPTNLTPSGMIDDIMPTFTWSPVAGAARYDLWVNDRTGKVDEFIREENLTGTSFTPTSVLGDGEFRFWVRAISGDGTPGPWSAAQNVTIAISELDRPVWISPVGDIFDSQPRFRWSSVGGATKYDLWVRNLTTNENEFIREREIPLPEFTPPLLPEDRFRVWVRAINDAGVSSEWSEGATFTNFAINLQVDSSSTPIRFFGYERAHAFQYDLWVDNQSTGERQVIRETDITSTEYLTEELTYGEYRAWMRPVYTGQETGSWSSIVYFNIGATLIAPARETTDATPTFFWEVSFLGSRYELWVQNLTTKTRVIFQENLTTTSYTPTEDLPPGEYRAWVRAFDEDAIASPYSLQYDFTILPG